MDQLGQHLQFSNLNSNDNHAYKKHHSTETLLLKVQNDILINMDNRRVTILVLLDLSAAFDTVNINILTEIFKQRFNINDTSLKSLISYLTDRKQS